MKLITLLATASSLISISIQAATLHLPDTDFIEQSAALGVSQLEWDQGEMAASTFPNAYKFTRAYQITPDAGNKTLAPEKWKQNDKLDLSKLSGVDAGGEIDLYTLLRDRLKNHSMVVIQNDTVVHQHFFNGMNANSTHLDMSVTKSFTATLAGIAAAEGKLDMSKPVEYYLPQYKGTAFEGASVQEVADMRSGLKIKTPPHKSWDPRLTQSQEWHGQNDSGLHGIDDYLVLIDERKYPSGEVYQYQDPNTEMLGKLVEKATGENLADYFEKTIWQKVGAENDAFWMADPDGFVVASGGLNMTTRDLARIGKVILNDGKNYQGEQVIPKAFLDAIWSGNDEVKNAWTKGKEYALANDAWYKDQYRILNIEGRKILVMIGIHGQVMAAHKESGVVIAMNGGYPQTETPRMANLIFYQVIPAILTELEK